VLTIEAMFGIPRNLLRPDIFPTTTSLAPPPKPPIRRSAALQRVLALAGAGRQHRGARAVRETPGPVCRDAGNLFRAGEPRRCRVLHGDRRGWVLFAIACLTASKNSPVNTTKADRQFLPSRKHVRSFCAASNPVITPSSSNLLYPNFCKIEPPEAPLYTAQSVHQRL
jgi:hypothetical protein